MSMFVERGKFSKQVYMSKCNHRDMDFGPIMDPHGDAPSMRSSFVNPKEVDAFDRSDLMSFFFHSISDEPCDLDDDLLCTPSMLHVTASHLSDGETPYMPGYIPNRKCVPVSGADFKRLLLFFGYEWVDEEGDARTDDEPPLVGDLVSFCRLFDSVRLSNTDEFKQFLNDFDLLEFYPMRDDSVTVQTHCWNFGELLRAVTRVRIGTFEGQHRFYLFVTFLTGHFIPDNKTFLSRKVFEEAFSGDGCKDYQYHGMQLWKPMRHRVGRVAETDGGEETSMSCMLSKLKLHGRFVTQSQGRSIEATIKHVVLSVLERYTKRLKGGGADVVPMDFEHFWRVSGEQDAWNPNFAWAIDEFFDTVEKNEYRTQAFPKQHNTESDAEMDRKWQHLETFVRKRFVSAPKYFPRPPRVNQSGVPENMMLMLHALRNVCNDAGACRNLLCFLSLPNPRHPQGHPDVGVAPPDFCEMAWLKQHVFDPLYWAKVYFGNKMLMESSVVHGLRSTDCPANTVKLAVGHAKKSAVSFYGMEVTGVKTISLKKVKDTGLTLENVGITTSTVFHKIEYAINAAIFNDVMDVINEYGFDPALTNPGPAAEIDGVVVPHKMNNNVRCYLL